ncbi:MAG TPA: hypothetical protein VIM87_02570 [Chitinophaga sp.]
MENLKISCMLRKLSFVLAFVLISSYGFSQFKVGKTQAEVKEDIRKKNPRLIGSKNSGLVQDFGLYYVEADDAEYLGCSISNNTAAGANKQITLLFNSLQEEADFYNYVLGLYDNFKDNEVTLHEMKIVPRKKDLFGINNMIFDIYVVAFSGGPTNKYTSFMIGKKGWIKLFEHSKIHGLEK